MSSKEHIKDEVSTSTASTSQSKDVIRDFQLFGKIVGFPKRKSNKQLLQFESTVNTKDIQSLQHQNTDILPAEVLYKYRLFEKQQRVFQHYSQQQILCMKEQQFNRTLVNHESYIKLKNAGYATIHVGAILLSVVGMHRRHYGAKVLLCLVDTRTTDLRKGIISQTEIDLDDNIEYIYITPERLSMTIKDFSEHLQLLIQTKGYEDWTNGEANLTIVTAVTARISNYVQHDFRTKESKHIPQFLTSRGIKAIEGYKYNPTDLNGQLWNLELPIQQQQKQLILLLRKFSSKAATSLATNHILQHPILLFSDDEENEHRLNFLRESDFYQFEEIGSAQRTSDWISPKDIRTQAQRDCTEILCLQGD